MSNEVEKVGRKSVWWAVGRTVLFVFECIGYLLLTLSFLWLIFDVFGKKKK